MASFRDLAIRSIAFSAVGGVRGKTSLMMAGPPAGTAALVDAGAVYLAFRSNNPLGDVVLAYARTSYGALDSMLSSLEVPRARLIRGSVFADYLYGAGSRISLDAEVSAAADLLAFAGAIKRCVLGSLAGAASLDKFCAAGSAAEARFLPVLEAAVSLREGVIASAARTAIEASKKTDASATIQAAVNDQIAALHADQKRGVARRAITNIERGYDGQPMGLGGHASRSLLERARPRHPGRPWSPEAQCGSRPKATLILHHALAQP